MRQTIVNLLRKRGVTSTTDKIKKFISFWTCTHRTMKLKEGNIMYCPKCETKFKIDGTIHRL